LPPTVDLPALIDRNRIGAFQIRLLLIVGLAVVLDGFDVQAMGYVAPAIIQQWGVSRAALTPIFGAGLLGMLIGSLLQGVVADRTGRRPVLIGATLYLALCMLATAHATDLAQLRLLRFITGLGMGAIMPGAVALAGEYSPRRKRVTLMMLVSCGFTLGAVLGGLVSAVVIPRWGWQSVFDLAGIFALLLVGPMVRLVPESLQFMVLRRRHPDRIAELISRIDPRVTVDPTATFVVPEVQPSGAPVAELFRDGRARLTLLLWAVNFLNLIDLYFLANWLPTIATGDGMSVSEAVLLGTALQVGGVVGTVVLGPVVDRMGFPRVLIPTFLAAGSAMALIGRPGLSPAGLFAVVSVTGFCVFGIQPALVALAASSYPTTLRSTGVGWSLGFGRIGSIVGPVLGGALIALNWSNRDLFLAGAAPALISAALVMALGNRSREKVLEY
jgi:AAHS family 4-hydroxybenzoate transporter-like MFS transporter